MVFIFSGKKLDPVYGIRQTWDGSYIVYLAPPKGQGRQTTCSMLAIYKYNENESKQQTEPLTTHTHMQIIQWSTGAAGS